MLRPSKILFIAHEKADDDSAFIEGLHRLANEYRIQITWGVPRSDESVREIDDLRGGGKL